MDRLLLLADDGRMARLLQSRLPDVSVKSIDKVTDGILELSRNHYTTVLLNAQSLEKKTAGAVKGLRQIGPKLKILLYGDPFTEIYTRQALRCGADDYLVWPIPASELCGLLGINSRLDQFIIQPTQPMRLMEQYRELSQWAGQDKSILINRAEKILAETLGVGWVTICENGVKRPSRKEQETPSQTLPLIGPLGEVGQLLVGPDSQPGHRASQELLNESAKFIAALVNLAQRCEGLKHLATVDELTGAYNRRYLEFYLQKIIDHNKKNYTYLALLLFDIDDFKHYNDTYGHGAGDDVLRQVTQLIRRCCREQDVVARIGGDEFAVLFWDVGKQREKYSHNDREESADSTPIDSHSGTAFFLSNRFRRLLMASKFPALGPEARGVLTISGGLANFGHDATTPEQLLTKADDALLAAKRSGKNRIYLVGPEEAI